MGLEGLDEGDALFIFREDGRVCLEMLRGDRGVGGRVVPLRVFPLARYLRCHSFVVLSSPIHY